MKTAIQLQEEYNELKQQLVDFEKNLPKEFVLVKGKVVKNEKIVIASFQSKERTYMGNENKDYQIEEENKILEVKVNSFEEFTKDLQLLSAKFDSAEELKKSDFISKEFISTFTSEEKDSFTPPDLFYHLFCNSISCEFKGYDAARNIIEDTSTEEAIPVSDYLKENSDERICLSRSYREYHEESFAYTVVLGVMNSGDFKKTKPVFNRNTKQVE